MLSHKRRKTIDEKIADEAGPPDSRHSLDVTIDADVLRWCKEIYACELEKARVEDRAEPLWSHTIEMILRKGVKSYGPRRPVKRDSDVSGSAD